MGNVLEFFSVDNLYKINDWLNTRLGQWLVVMVIISVAVWVSVNILDEIMKKKNATLIGYLLVFPLSILRGFGFPNQFYDRNGLLLEIPIKRATMTIWAEGVVFAFMGIAFYLVWTKYVFTNRVAIFRFIARVVTLGQKKFKK